MLDKGPKAFDQFENEILTLKREHFFTDIGCLIACVPDSRKHKLLFFFVWVLDKLRSDPSSLLWDRKSKAHYLDENCFLSFLRATECPCTFVCFLDSLRFDRVPGKFSALSQQRLLSRRN